MYMLLHNLMQQQCLISNGAIGILILVTIIGPAVAKESSQAANALCHSIVIIVFAVKGDARILDLWQQDAVNFRQGYAGHPIPFQQLKASHNQ